MNYDVAIIGAGPGGTDAAEHAAAHGLRVVIFEKNKLGGVCLNEVVYLRRHSCTLPISSPKPSMARNMVLRSLKQPSTSVR